MIVSLQSVLDIFDDYYQDHSGYLLTYKLSQDHLEVYFSAVRRRGGYNNNPTAYEFINIFKRLLVHTHVKGSDKGNCLLLDETKLLQVPENELLESSEIDFSLDESEVNPDCFQISNGKLQQSTDFYGSYDNLKYVNDVVIYIAGCVVNSVLRRKICFSCPPLLCRLSNEDSQSEILDLKNRGGLVKPCDDVISVCQIAERLFRLMYQSRKGIYNALVCTCLRKIPLVLL